MALSLGRTPERATLVGEQGDGAGGQIGLFSAPSADPAIYFANVMAQLLAAGWAATSLPENFAPPNEREGAFTKPPQSLAFRINTYTYCAGAAQISVDVVG